jgi:hypothetical protein
MNPTMSLVFVQYSDNGSLAGIGSTRAGAAIHLKAGAMNLPTLVYFRPNTKI